MKFPRRIPFPVPPGTERGASIKSNIAVLLISVFVLVSAVTGVILLIAHLVGGAAALTAGNGKADPIYGRCQSILVATRCTDIPLAAVSKYGGITFPSGAKVISSSSSGENFYDGGYITATVKVPGGVDRAETAIGTVSPNNRITYDPQDDELMTVKAYVPGNE